MKKAFLTLTLVLFAGVSFGQSVASVSQNGNTNNSNVTQSGPNNNALVEQIGTNNSIIKQKTVATGNEATVKQNGGAAGLNKSYVEQEGGSGGKQQAFTTQDGSKNQAVQKQLAPWPGYDVAKMNQIGTNNKGEQFQKAYNNTATLMQDGDDNVSKQDQTNSGDPKHLKSEVEQYQNENNSVTTQGGTNHRVNVLQDGLKNKSNTYQYGGGWNDAGHKAGVKQVGDNNIVDLDQVGSGGVDAHGNKANLKQAGNNNYAKLNQNGMNNKIDAGDDGYMNNAQKGTNHDLYIDQIGDENFAYYNSGNGSDNNLAKVKQLGHDDNAQIHQWGSNGKVDISQTGITGVFSHNGDNNTAGVTQYGGSQVAKITQTGQNHTAKTYQQNSNNNVDITQVGDVFDGRNERYSAGWPGAPFNNQARTWQGGSNNKIKMNQTGTENNGFVTQDGVGNAVNTLTQTGKDNWADLDMTGDANIGTVISIGDGNTVDLDIVGSSNKFNISQNSNGNSANAVQTGNSNSVNITQN